MEKTGNTAKIKYDFNTAANLEIFMPTLKNWYRVTPREFRAFNGKRRINHEGYEGPIYIYDTNKIAQIADSAPSTLVGYSWVSKKRPGE
jgi:hypothetical protein